MNKKGSLLHLRCATIQESQVAQMSNSVDDPFFGNPVFCTSGQANVLFFGVGVGVGVGAGVHDGCHYGWNGMLEEERTLLAFYNKTAVAKRRLSRR